MTFDEFLDAELAGLRRYAAVLTGDRDRAHDTLAEALLRAHTGWGRIGRMQFPAAYVRRMVTSTFLSEQRRWTVRHIRPTSNGELPEVALPDPTAAVDDQQHLRPLLAALPPRQRAAIVLRFYLGLSNDEIAAELGISAGAARTAVSRALSALRIAIAEDGDTGAPPAGPVSRATDPGSASLAPAGTGASHDVTPIRPRPVEHP